MVSSLLASMACLQWHIFTCTQAVTATRPYNCPHRDTSRDAKKTSLIQLSSNFLLFLYGSTFLFMCQFFPFYIFCSSNPCLLLFFSFCLSFRCFVPHFHSSFTPVVMQAPRRQAQLCAVDCRDKAPTSWGERKKKILARGEWRIALCVEKKVLKEACLRRWRTLNGNADGQIKQ